MKTWTDADDNVYELRKLVRLAGDRACKGCDFEFNNKSCQQAPSCTHDVNRTHLGSDLGWVMTSSSYLRGVK